MFQLFMPGPRATTDGASPMVPAAGRANAAVLNQWSNVRWSLGSVGLPTTTGRQPSPPPVRSTPSVRSPVPKLLLELPLPELLVSQNNGAPLTNRVVPASCQPSNTFLTTELLPNRLAFGRAIK